MELSGSSLNQKYGKNYVNDFDDHEDSKGKVSKSNDREDSGTVGQKSILNDNKQASVTTAPGQEHTAEEFIAILNCEVEELKKENTILLQKLKSDEDRYVDKSKLIKEHEGTIKILKDQIEANIKENEKLKENFETIDDTLREKVAELAEKARQYSVIECNMRTLQNECDTQKQSVNELTEKIKQKDNELAKKEHDIELVKEQCETDKKTYIERQYRLKKFITHYKQEINTRRKNEEKQAREIERLQQFETVHPALKDQLVELEKKLGQSEREKIEIINNLTLAENEMKQLREDAQAAELEKQTSLLRDKEAKREMERLISNYKQDINTRKQNNEEQAMEIERLQQFEAVHPALKDQLVELEKKLNQSERGKFEIKNKLTLAENESKQLREDARAAEQEKQTLLLRLSKMAGAKLTVDNPNIADLSDGKRPTRLAEEFAELYDNEWTDAFEDVKFEDEREKVSFMLDLLQKANELCHEVSNEHMNKIKTGICTLTIKDPSRGTSNEQHLRRVNESDSKDQAIPVHVEECCRSTANTSNSRSSPEQAEPRGPSMVVTTIHQGECTEGATEDEYEVIDKVEQSSDELTPEQSQTEELHEVVFDFKSFPHDLRKTVMELRKFIEVNLSDQFEKVATDAIARKSSIDSKARDKVLKYISKCVNICWSMCRHEPPVYISFPKVQDSMHLDTSVYKPYTRSGKHIDYIVWPAIYLYENGPVLGKGVAQGKN